MDTFLPTAEFEKWALGFSGCDGGNPAGKTWLCGIEYGGSDTEETLQFSDVTAHSHCADPDWFLKFQYNWKAAKLLCALAGQRVADYRTFFRADRCFADNSDYFKLNLYPLCFKTTAAENWTELHTRKTGFRSKADYIVWCREFRFAVLRQWLARYRPKLVICTGNSRAPEFFEAFGCDGEAQTQLAGGKAIQHSSVPATRTLVAVIYFLGGRYGLKSDEQLQATGEALAQLLRQSSAYCVNSVG